MIQREIKIDATRNGAVKNCVCERYTVGITSSSSGTWRLIFFTHRGAVSDHSLTKLLYCWIIPFSRLVFPSLHLSRWAFDIELVELIKLARIPLAEVKVNWTEVEGSKLNVLTAAPGMLM